MIPCSFNDQDRFYFYFFLKKTTRTQSPQCVSFSVIFLHVVVISRPRTRKRCLTLRSAGCALPPEPEVPPNSWRRSLRTPTPCHGWRVRYSPTNTMWPDLGCCVGFGETMDSVLCCNCDCERTQAIQFGRQGAAWIWTGTLPAGQTWTCLVEPVNFLK